MTFFSRKISLQLLIILVFTFLLSINLFGQPTNSEAKNIYDEAISLTQRGTAEGFQKAFAKFEIAKGLFEKEGNKEGLAHSFLGMGFTSQVLGKRSEAIGFYNLALPLFRELKNKAEEARTLSNLGVIHRDLGDRKKALEIITSALILKQEAGDKKGEAGSLNNLAGIYFELGEIGKALTFFNQALKIRQSPNIENNEFNQRGIAGIFNNIGHIYRRLGEEEKALDYFNRSLEINKRLGNKGREAVTLNNIGLVYQDLGKPEKAVELYKESLAIREVVGDKIGAIRIQNNIGLVYLDAGEYQKALEIFDQCLILVRKNVDREIEGKVLNNLGAIYSKLKQYKKAIDYFNQALATQTAIGDRIPEANSYQQLMGVWRAENNNQLAIFYGKQSVNMYQEFRQTMEKLDIETRKSYLKTIENAYRQLADLLIEAGRFAQAEQVLRMLKEEEYFDFVRRDADEIKSLEQRVLLTEKEKKLIERYSNLTEKVAKIGNEFAELEKRKSNLSTEEQKRFEELGKQLADASAAFKLFLEKELLAEFGKAKQEEIEYDRTLQDSLKKWGEGTVTLYTVISENRYRVILTTPNVQVDGKTEISAAELNKKIFAYREALQNIEIDPRPLGKELYDILIKPIEKDLKAANAKTLVWSLDGTLRYIPISTLSPDGKTYLVERYRNVITTPKTREDISDLDTEWRALGVGISEPQTVANPENPDEKIDFSSIPGTKVELITIVRDEETPNEKGILTGRRFLDKDFTINSLSESLGTKNAFGKRKFTAVHIASHFQLGTNWANSFLLLGNGEILTLKELKNSAEINFGDVELVTLSACDTAFTADSNGKEVDSLASVIQAKSGKAVLAALWAVVDESTPLLMSEFYRLRKDNPKMTKAEAMQKVQKAFVTGELKPSAEYIKKLEDYYEAISKNSAKPAFKFEKEASFAHPYFWSPFVLIGNWR